jgi:hypothetical protein
MSLYAFRLGSALLLRAAGRCIRVADEVGGVALLIDPKTGRRAGMKATARYACSTRPFHSSCLSPLTADALGRGI